MADATLTHLNGHAILAGGGKTKRKRVLTGKILLSVSEDMLKQVQDYRFDKRITSLSLAVRRLIEIGLEAEKRQADQQQSLDLFSASRVAGDH